ncbi:N-acetyl-alpha-D-glucosaminyl L-malate synthase BshA [Oceanobacillus halophilus]|uniref:N-acetyl-alpha-D-glucosaminyl L-malate synthase BshA n=1 Tax=Oceanobacillus halophilus TaxID=930130 RepID=A0A495ACV9_9BACI|nr:N-acetyl-alpha-D-glucosaminyl L-malate synthase BshA [Oceanobacillus halophilus]RKQ37643.1 N-acetyl-alpha-D-glucosaminyl L-malate synthase BshA [Oceanobacillus halophilus]
MKIGITCYPTVGGSGVIATELGKMLAEDGNEIHFISSSLPFRLDKFYPNIFYHEVDVGHYPVFQYPPYDLALATKMADVIDEKELDVLHVHYAVPHAICAILAKDIAERDVKIVTTLHGTDITVLGVDNTFKKMIKYGIEKSDAVTAVSKSLVNQTKEMIDTNKDISIIYNFVNEEEYMPKQNPTLKQKYGIAAEEKVMIHISNFRRVKRVDEIVHTFRKVKEQVNSKLLLVGDGPEYSSTVQLVKNLGLDNDVLFLGKQNNISDLLSISDLMLLLSEKESFGLVLLEAMACMVPCIGTDVGGIPEVIKHEETGYTVELGNTELAAKYAIQLLEDTEKLEEFSRNAFNHTQRYFKSSEIVKQYMNLYKHILISKQ